MLQSLIASGTKLWLDSIDPELVRRDRAAGATGATSNPIIVTDLVASGRFDDDLDRLGQQRVDDADLAWRITDRLVRDAEEVFLPVWRQTRGNDGYVSFELDPLVEDPDANLSHAERVRRYIELGQHWSAGRPNRLIKVPATPAGIEALEPLAVAGVKLNVTLTFSPRQYRAARDAIWRGALARGRLDDFKSVYSIFVSRVDVYTEKHAAGLSPAAQGMVGIVNAKRIWRENQQFWAEHPTPHEQEIVFASTGTKRKGDPPWKYVEAFAGSGIETNPPATNQAVADSGRTFTRQVDQLPPPEVLDEIDRTIDMEHLEATLMAEGIRKFTDPQKALLALIARKSGAVVGS